jgi:hypothetical protein
MLGIWFYKSKFVRINFVQLTHDMLFMLINVYFLWVEK